MLDFFALNNIEPGLRPPNTSHVVQNEDLVTFWQLRNDSTNGINPTKQAWFCKILLETGRTSLNYSDAMPCLTPA